MSLLMLSSHLNKYLSFYSASSLNALEESYLTSGLYVEFSAYQLS